MGGEEPIEAVAERFEDEIKTVRQAGTPSKNLGQYMFDQHRLAHWAIARLARDRAEQAERAKPIDEEFVIATLGGSMSFKADALDGATVTVWATRLSPSGFELGIAHGDTEYVHNLTITTRGQLLDLLAALGVERKGGG